MQYPFSERMKKVKRVIIHSDINNCYASIERQLNPSLAGKPIAVCGAAEERHGIVLAKSYEAKAFGVQTGEAIWQAKNKCHNLIIVSPHYDKYVQYSRLAHEIYKKYTPLIEPYGLDAGTAIYDTIPKKPTARESIRDKLKSAQKAQPPHTPKPQKSKGKDMEL